jgi:hypothetical protein
MVFFAVSNVSLNFSSYINTHIRVYAGIISNSYQHYQTFSFFVSKSFRKLFWNTRSLLILREIAYTPRSTGKINVEMEADIHAN